MRRNLTEEDKDQIGIQCCNCGSKKGIRISSCGSC